MNNTVSFKEAGFCMDDQIFLFDYSDKMWFDPGSNAAGTAYS